MAADTPPFVIRLLPSSGLDGAFRVHLPPDSLEKLGLQVGDLCQITGDNEGSLRSGYGIAWRATDRMGNSPKLRPAKMTDQLRTAFGLKEGSHVSIAKTSAQVVQAKKVSLSDVTPSDYGAAADFEDQDWDLRCHYLLANCEAVAAGITFDVTAKKGLRKRFFVDHVETDGSPTGTPALFTVRGKTEVVVSDGAVTPRVEDARVSNEDNLSVLDTTTIGGLVEQVKELNKRLDRLLDNSLRTHTAGSPLNAHILLHGYEGTGKTMVLDNIRTTSRCKVFRLSKAGLAAGVALKNHAVVQALFKDALASQPSLVLIDDIDKLAPPDDDKYSPMLGSELDMLKGSRVLVVATARSGVTGVDATLLRPHRLSKTIELPIPDIEARRQILQVLLGASASMGDAVAERTHGFTGADLAMLVWKAQDNAFGRHEIEGDALRGWVDVQPEEDRPVRESGTESMPTPTPPPDAPSIVQVDGSVHSSQATTRVESAASGAMEDEAAAEGERVLVSMGDVEAALVEVRPTALREVFLEKPQVRWADIGGSGAMKQRFDETIGWPMKYPDIDNLLGLEAQKGVLLYGPPGCSKTLTAQAIATSYDLNFIAVKGAELISMYVGESERAVREVFRKAKQARPCIIFFDEIDSIGAEREGGASKGLNVLTTLLTEMDGFETMKGVLVLAATNKPEILDPALLRPGRFDEHVYIGVPTAEARRDILAICLRDRPISDDVAYDAVVTAMDGYSGAEIVGLCKAAKQKVRRRMVRADMTAKIGQKDLEEAISETPKGITVEMLEAYEKFAARK